MTGKRTRTIYYHCPRATCRIVWSVEHDPTDGSGGPRYSHCPTCRQKYMPAQRGHGTYAHTPTIWDEWARHHRRMNPRMAPR